MFADMSDNTQPNLARLLDIMARLRDPETGCPWDVAQSFATIAPYTIEEAYEVADAIERGDMGALKDELGDLLLQAVFHARMAEEQGLFAFDDVAGAIADKLVRRHPHVFGDGPARQARAAFSVDVWEASKADERKAKATGNGVASLLDDVALALPALTRAEKLQKRAARVGFDWPEVSQVLDKIEEEIKELRFELEKSPAPRETVAEELGDLMFALVNLGRWLEVDPEEALRATNAKFVKRFRFIEQELEARERDIRKASLEEMEALWSRAKNEV